MWGILIPFLIGLAVGYYFPGRQDKSMLFARAAIWAVVLAAVLVLLARVFGVNPLGMGDVGFLALTISFLVSIVAFLFGVWVGDLGEGRRRPSRPMMPPRRV